MTSTRQRPPASDTSRRDIAVDSGGVTLRGWFSPAAGDPGPAPVVVM